MSIRSKLVLSLSVLLAINFAFGLYAFQTYRQAISSAEEVSDWANQIVTISLSAQVHFKKQVQEWKNILLRGHDPKFYDKYLNQFYDEERKTRHAIETLLPLLENDTEIKNTTQAFYQAHQILGGQYRDALASYHTASADPHIVVDRLVRGIDREPTDLLDEVVRNTLLEKEARLAEISAEAAKIRTQILAAVLGVLTLPIFLLMWFADHAIGKPISAATRIAGRIANGDLSSDISAQGRSETARLLQALKTMQSNLVEYQDSVRKSEERIRLLLDSSGEGIYGVDKQGHCMFINPAGVNLLKYQSADELLGKEIHSLMHHTRPDGSEYPFDECPATDTFRTGRVCNVEDEVFWRADGTSFPVEYSSYPIRNAGNLIGAVVMFSDITRRKESELALTQAHEALQEERALLARRVEERTAELHLSNAELARSARAKDEFLASMSHEFRTPLTTILGTSELLLDGMYGDLNEDQLRAVSNIEDSAKHLLSLISDILEVTKIEAGRIELNPEAVSVTLLCEASIRLVRHQAEKKELKVLLEIDSRVDFIDGDPLRLRQLLVNLLSNAVKFTPEGGSIGLQVLGEPESGVATFTVWDTGIGITMEDMGRLFKPFVQLNSNLHRHHPGTGLGLVLAYRMAELHGGGISVTSEPGKGSRFTVTLPWTPEQISPEQPEQLSGGSELASTHAGTVKGTKVLLAEDHEANAAMLTNALHSRGYQVIQVVDGVEALAVARETRPDIILMDIQMPNLDGLGATRQIRTDPVLHDVPVIALTALTMPGDRERCLNAGVTDYLEKPVSVRGLLKTIGRHLGDRKHG